MILFQNDESHIKLTVRKRDVPYRIDMHLKKNKAKGVAINGIPIRRASELFGIVNVVFFSPEDLNLIKNGPAERRKFIDLELCQLNKRDFMDNIDRAMILIRDSDRKPIIMNVEDSNVNMRVKSAFGSMNANVPAHKSGKDIMIAFNPKFLLDALRVIDDEDVELYMMNPKSPCFIKDEEGSYIYLILPVNFINEA